MGVRPRRKFTTAFRQEAVAQVLDRDRKPPEVARDLDVPVKNLYRWVRQERARRERVAAGGPTDAELAELQRLRKDNARLREEREILKKAAAFFARESL